MNDDFTDSPSGAISPLDGRYHQKVDELRHYCSEFALSRARVRVEVEWFKRLLGSVASSSLPSAEELSDLDKVYLEFNLDDEKRIRHLERQTNHDVKAVEYFVKERVAALGLSDVKELVHFACTSEDITNVAYALNLDRARTEVLIPRLLSLLKSITDLAESHAGTAMLARTHGQAASPTTLGKELVTTATRLQYWSARIANVSVKAKFNGAVGNFNAHATAFPEIDWEGFTADFLRDLGLEQNRWTTQIEPHDWLSDWLNAIVGFNQVLLDFDRDIWGYISIGYFKQQMVEGEVGSSTMPHKVNPIDFENSEGNLGIASAIARHLSEKLLVSRWQRDLSDSTALRNIGSVLGHTTLAIDSCVKGIGKLEVDSKRIYADLDQSWEVLAEPLQTLMRQHGVQDPYETLKELTRGESLDEHRYVQMLEDLPLDAERKKSLTELTPHNYVGLAEQLTLAGVTVVREAIAQWKV